MGGGNIQLIEYGDHDIYLTGKPQITFFKMNYKRHTNFAMEEIPQTFIGNPNISDKFSIIIHPYGDLISKCYLKLKINTTNKKFHYETAILCIKYVEIEIGNQIIDKHYNVWLSIWNQLTVPYEKRDAYNRLTIDEYITEELLIPNNINRIINSTAYIPLEFWFCRNIGLALPLIALQYNEVRINIEFITGEELLSQSGYVNGDVNISNTELIVNYIYLDTDERRKIAQSKHEYLIDTVQTQIYYKIFQLDDYTIKLNFSNCVKALYWVHQLSNGINSLLNFAYVEQYIEEVLLILDGQVIEKNYPTYYTNIQPYKYHSSSPYKLGLFMYSFCLNPEEFSPSGCLNFSKIENFNFVYTGVDVSNPYETIYIFALTSNILQIQSGMASLVYSN